MPWGVGFVAGNGGGGDESHKLHRSSTAIAVSKTKRPKSSQLWRLLDQDRSKQEGTPPAQSQYKALGTDDLWPQRNTGRENCRFGLCKFTYEMASVAATETAV
jgi:hypothetical protein